MRGPADKTLRDVGPGPQRDFRGTAITSRSTHGLHVRGWFGFGVIRMSVIDNDQRILAVGAPPSPCGGSFRLNKKSDLTRVESPVAGWSAELVVGSQQIVVRGLTPIDNYAEALGESYLVAQQALDLLTMRCLTSFVIEDADSGHIVWWTSDRAVFARIVRVCYLGFHITATATATVTDKDGHLIPPGSASITRLAREPPVLSACTSNFRLVRRLPEHVPGTRSNT